MINKFLFLTCLFAGMLVSCSSDNDDECSTSFASGAFAPLKNAIYLKVADEEQPAWIQSLIAKSPYMKVFRSGKEEGLFLVEVPLQGNGVSVFDNEGKEMSVTMEEQFLQIVQDGQPWTLTHIYSFPLKPGDTEWDLNRYTVAEIKDMLQLPQTLLSSMATSDLIEICLDYHYSIEFLFADEFQYGVESVSKEFNGFEELLKRKDLVESMLRKYEIKIQTTEMIETQESLVRGRWSVNFLLFKMLLAQNEMLGQLNREQLRLLIKLSREATNMVASYPELLGDIHIVIAFYLYSRIVVREGGFNFVSDEEKSRLEYFAQTCTMDPNVYAIFTPDMQQRIYMYLESL